MGMLREYSVEGYLPIYDDYYYHLYFIIHDVSIYKEKFDLDKSHSFIHLN